LLEHVECWRSYLDSLNISGCSALSYLDCSNNNIKALDVSGSTALSTFNFSGNSLTEIKANIGGQGIILTANGNGTVVLGGASGAFTATAAPASPYGFVNWTESGSEVSASGGYIIPATGDHTLTANYSI
jgi:Leucine-rich repeat (LRR) protein